MGLKPGTVCHGQSKRGLLGKQASQGLSHPLGEGVLAWTRPEARQTESESTYRVELERLGDGGHLGLALAGAQW